jgi:hypothetical protein
MEKGKILRAFKMENPKIIFSCNNRFYKELKEYVEKAIKDGYKWISLSSKELREQYKNEEDALFE